MTSSASSFSRSLINLILVGLALLLSVNAWHSTVYYADMWPFHVDELTYTQAAVNFFQSGNYTSNLYSGNFQPAISVGLAATWPSAIAWAFPSSSLFASRLVLGGAVWILYLLVGWLFLREQAYSNALKLCLLAAAWSLSLLVVPNAPLFLTNMGELIGALWVGLGLLVIRKSPYAAAFCWGIAVWSCKFIYAPLVMGFGAVWLVTLQERWVIRLQRAVVFLFWFLAPLGLWLAIIWIRFDGATVASWLQGMFGWLERSIRHWTPSDILGADQAPKAYELTARLNSLEWHTYAWDWKVKILALTFGSVFLSAGLLAKQSRLVTDRLSRRLTLVVVGSVSAYAAWYFLWHPYMYIRHIQPALYLGLGLYLFWLRQWAQKMRPFVELHQRLWLSLAVALVSIQTISVWQTPLLESAPTFARACTDLFSPDCGDYSAIAARIRQTPASILVRNGPPLPYQAFEAFYGPPDFTIPEDCSGQTEAVLAEQLRQATEGRNEVWLLRTMPVECASAELVPSWLAEHTYPAEEFWLQNNLFTRYLIAADLLARGTQAGWLGDSISLAAWGADKVAVAPGQALNIALTWNSPSTIMQDYRVFVFLADSSEQVAALRDAVPMMWLRPTWTWQPGEQIADHHALLIPPEASPGEYWLGVGMYDSATGERLPVTAGEGWLNDTALKLIPVTIQTP